MSACLTLFIYTSSIRCWSQSLKGVEFKSTIVLLSTECPMLLKNKPVDHGHSFQCSLCICLFNMIIYVPSTIFQLCRDKSSWVEPSGTKLGLMCLAQGDNTVTPVRLQPTAPRSRVKHSTTESQHSLQCVYKL